MQAAIERVAWRFAALTGAGFLAGYLEVSLWSLAGHRQARRARADYMQALLRRSMDTFDREDAGALVERALRDTQEMQRGIGEKMGSVIHFASTFTSSVALGFYLGWQLSLLILGCVPVLAASIIFLEATQSRAGRLSSEAYASAGSAPPRNRGIHHGSALSAQPAGGAGGGQSHPCPNSQPHARPSPQTHPLIKQLCSSKSLFMEAG